MRAGDLRHRVTILNPVETVKDAIGTPQLQWVAVDVGVPANVTPLGESEILTARQAGATTTHRVAMRYRTDVSPRTRLEFNGRRLAIEATINRDERNRELLLRCHEIEAKDDA